MTNMYEKEQNENIKSLPSSNGVIITEEMQKAFDLIEQGESLFITGKAGSGKTTLLRLITQKYKLETIVCAPTGVAAVNAQGVTIHSLFQLPIGFLNPEGKIEYKLPTNKKNILKYAKILIIDEISMVRCDLMDAIDKRLRQARKSKLSFGGIQVIMFGDLKQLSPVVTSDEGEVLSEFYDNFFFYNALVFKNFSFYTLELQEIFRQRDEKFIKLLNDIRNGFLSDDDNVIISNLKQNKASDNAIHLCALKCVADTINESMLGKPTHTYIATIKNDFRAKDANCDIELKLRVGARVMITINDSLNKTYYNGTLGYVEKLTNDTVFVRTDEGNLVPIEPHTWESYKYETHSDLVDGKIKVIVDKEVIGTCTQFPLTLAYAITIHKSQGLTFDNVVLHIREIFQSGQLYTALSRCRTLENISIDYPITTKMLQQNSSVDDFWKIVKENNNYYGNFELSC